MVMGRVYCDDVKLWASKVGRENAGGLGRDLLPYFTTVTMCTTT